MSVQMMAAVLLQHFTFEPIHPTGQEIPVDYDITVLPAPQLLPPASSLLAPPSHARGPRPRVTPRMGGSAYFPMWVMLMQLLLLTQCTLELPLRSMPGAPRTQTL